MQPIFFKASALCIAWPWGLVKSLLSPSLTLCWSGSSSFPLCVHVSPPGFLLLSTKSSCPWKPVRPPGRGPELRAWAAFRSVLGSPPPLARDLAALFGYSPFLLRISLFMLSCKHVLSLSSACKLLMYRDLSYSFLYIPWGLGWFCWHFIAQ